jgi:hypothetical protein
MRKALWTAALLVLGAVAAHGDFDAEVTAPPGFADGLGRVAVLAVACHESVDCAQVEDAAAEELANRRPPFAIVPPARVREALFAAGASELTDELRAALLDELGADGVLEIRVPFANRGDGFGGRRRSEARVEVRLVARDGRLLMTGRGTGRPKNVVSGSERVAATVVEKILVKAFSGT